MGVGLGGGGREIFFPVPPLTMSTRFITEKKMN